MVSLNSQFIQFRPFFGLFKWFGSVLNADHQHIKHFAIRTIGPGFATTTAASFEASQK